MLAIAGAMAALCA